MYTINEIIDSRGIKMEKICYENIDLFFYHSIDIDFARLFSILNYGIVSKKVAKEEGIKYYYRNYIHSSAKNEYISVNHFPNTIFRYYHIENELYDFNTNKICFIIDDIDALEKQAYRNRHRYTNERHVHYKIDSSQIKGILLRNIDAKKRISDISFDYRFTDKTYFESKVFTMINFFMDIFGTFGNTNKIYYLIGKLQEAKLYESPDEIIMELIAREMKNNINCVLSSVLGIDNPTLLDAISYFNNDRYPIYLMNRYDIQLAGRTLKTTDDRLERFKNAFAVTISEMKQQKSIDKKTLKLAKKMTNSGLDIYYGYSIGPLNEQDFEIVEEIKKLSLKKEETY